MSSHRRNKPRRQDPQREIRLVVFDNEPLARLAEQRLRQAAIPCVVKTLGGGAGMWGTAYNQPHGLYVFPIDERRAREVLELPPKEVAERESLPESSAASALSDWRIQGIVLIIVVILVALLLAALLRGR